jgi:hypothetical protein
VFSDVVYVDSFRNTHKFYEDTTIQDFVDKNKEYDGKSNMTFYQQDYNQKIPEDYNSFDIVISQYG